MSMKNLVSKVVTFNDLKRSLRAYLNLGITEVESKKPRHISYEKQLNTLKQEVLGCQKCPLHRGKKNYVFGEGNPKATLMFVGEAPGFYEDQQGKPFVGKAGQMLTKIIKAMGFERKDVYIANILKCRPPDNRNPQQDEMEACFPFLNRQVKLINPEVICALGKFAAQKLTGSNLTISNLRGKLFYYESKKLIPTFHPSYLLRSPRCKRETWEDMKMILKILGKDIKSHG
ncbi:MAG: uracil-DNA glycosylase [Candidatus Cloacimonadota bacterium]|nr:MAG: uracil-DNA glycosylase [Candidatus Cloacimonadota bacterium]